MTSRILTAPLKNSLYKKAISSVLKRSESTFSQNAEVENGLNLGKNNFKNMIENHSEWISYDCSRIFQSINRPLQDNNAS
jgi:hypothetical protein